MGCYYRWIALSWCSSFLRLELEIAIRVIAGDAFIFGVDKHSLLIFEYRPVRYRTFVVWTLAQFDMGYILAHGGFLPKGFSFLRCSLRRAERNAHASLHFSEQKRVFSVRYSVPVIAYLQFLQYFIS